MTFRPNTKARVSDAGFRQLLIDMALQSDQPQDELCSLALH